MRGVMIALLSLFVAYLAGCSSSEDKPAAGEKPGAAAPAAKTPAAPAAPAAKAAPAPAAAGAVAPTPEMTGFMAMLDGKDGCASKALKKYGATKPVQDDDLGMYNLEKPKLIKGEKVGAQQCFTMETAAGMMKHTTVLCWEGGKIAKLTDKSE